MPVGWSVQTECFKEGGREKGATERERGGRERERDSEKEIDTEREKERERDCLSMLAATIRDLQL